MSGDIICFVNQPFCWATEPPSLVIDQPILLSMGSRSQWNWSVTGDMLSLTLTQVKHRLIGTWICPCKCAERETGEPHKLAGHFSWHLKPSCVSADSVNAVVDAINPECGAWSNAIKPETST